MPRMKGYRRFLLKTLIFFLYSAPQNDQTRPPARDRKKKKMSDEEILARLRECNVLGHNIYCKNVE